MDGKESSLSREERKRGREESDEEEESNYETPENSFDSMIFPDSSLVLSLNGRKKEEEEEEEEATSEERRGAGTTVKREEEKKEEVLGESANEGGGGGEDAIDLISDSEEEGGEDGGRKTTMKEEKEEEKEEEVGESDVDENGEDDALRVKKMLEVPQTDFIIEDDDNDDDDDEYESEEEKEEENIATVITVDGDDEEEGEDDEADLKAFRKRDKIVSGRDLNYALSPHGDCQRGEELLYNNSVKCYGGAYTLKLLGEALKFDKKKGRKYENKPCAQNTSCVYRTGTDISAMAFSPDSMYPRKYELFKHAYEALKVAEGAQVLYCGLDLDANSLLRCLWQKKCIACRQHEKTAREITPLAYLHRVFRIIKVEIGCAGFKTNTDESPNENMQDRCQFKKAWSEFAFDFEHGVHAESKGKCVTQHSNITDAIDELVNKIEVVLCKCCHALDTDQFIREKQSESPNLADMNRSERQKEIVRRLKKKVAFQYRGSGKILCRKCKTDFSKFPELVDWDHKDEYTKLYEIGETINASLNDKEFSWRNHTVDYLVEKLYETHKREIAKTEFLCKCCHIKKTNESYEQRDMERRNYCEEKEKIPTRPLNKEREEMRLKRDNAIEKFRKKLQKKKAELNKRKEYSWRSDLFLFAKNEIKTFFENEKLWGKARYKGSIKVMPSHPQTPPRKNPPKAQQRQKAIEKTRLLRRRADENAKCVNDLVEQPMPKERVSIHQEWRERLYAKRAEEKMSKDADDADDEFEKKLKDGEKYVQNLIKTQSEQSEQHEEAEESVM
jgi:hypothetical protein